MTEWYCYVLGRRYGPVDITTLKRWIREGRLKADDQAWSQETDWVTVAQVPELSAVLTPGPSGPPPVVSPTSETHLKPHRGVLILILGLLGITSCAVVGIIALVMGSNDIQEMDSGIMDPTGRAMTNAGRILGIFSLVIGVLSGLWLVSLGFWM